MEIPKESGEREGSVFNILLALLEKVNNILKRIAEVTVMGSHEGGDINSGQAQHIKSRLVRQLYIQSIPLIDPDKDKDWKKEIWKRILNIKLSYGKVIKNYKIVGRFERFSEALEKELDDITMEIEEKLQTYKYFVPSKADPRHGWKQS